MCSNSGYKPRASKSRKKARISKASVLSSDSPVNSPLARLDDLIKGSGVPASSSIPTPFGVVANSEVSPVGVSYVPQVAVTTHSPPHVSSASHTIRG